MPFHHIQILPSVRPEFVEHGNLLGDGIDRGPAADRPHIISGLSAFRYLLFVKLIYDLGQDRNGIGVSEISVGMTADGLHFYLITDGAYSPFRDPRVISVKGDECLDPVPEVLTDRSGSLQISKPLFPAVAHKKKSVLRSKAFVLHLSGKIFCRQHQCRYIGCIISDAGAEDLSVRFCQRQRRRIREHNIGMCHEHHDLFMRIQSDRVDHVECPVDIHAFSSLIRQPFPAELRTFLFMV